MATTPNVPVEQSVKASVRGATPNGTSPYMTNPLPVINALSTTSGYWSLTVTDVSTSFVISGSAGNTTALSGASTVSSLISSLQSGPLSGSQFQVLTAPSGLVGTVSGNQATPVIILVNSGTPVGLTLATGGGATATLTNVFVSGTQVNTAYPNYSGTPYSIPTWIDDAIVHAYEVTGIGNVVQDTTRIVTKQVRQIRTGAGPDGGTETQDWGNYFALYQSNLNQTGQKRTQQQQC